MKLLSVLRTGVRVAGSALGALGRGTIALVGICGVVAALANYTMTQGSGTTFGSVVISTVHYAAQLVCDATVGGSQCAAVKPASTAAVATDPALVTQLNPNSPGIVALGQTTKSASVPVALASDQVGTAGTANATVVSVQGIASMTKLLVTPDSVALPANQSVNTAQVNGVATSTGTGVAGTGTQRVTLSNTDPCMSPDIAKSSVSISVTSATTTSLVAVSGSTVVYVCGFSMTIAPSATTADTAQFEYGTGAACTSPTVLTGTFGNGDLTSAAPVTNVRYGPGSTAFKSASSAGICIVTAGTAVNVQGVLTFVQQ
jgi:hypothetical protein